MKLVDTHCHLNFSDYDKDLPEVLTRAKTAGLVRIIVPGTDIKSSIKAVELAKKNKMIFAAVGVHPHEADDAGVLDVEKLRDIAVGSDKVIAIGEIGLDKYKNYSKIENQQKLFSECLRLARTLDLPVIIHNRRAGKEMLDILKKFKNTGIKGVFHCFSEDISFLNAILELGMYVSFAGNITFKNAFDSRKTAQAVPLEKLLLETDSPFITPEPYRGKRNEPAYVKKLLDVYAKMYKLSVEDVARVTTHNANKLFNLGIKEKGVIAYAIRDSLYLNITNRCTNRCGFCTRQYSNFVKGHKLSLGSEPLAGEIIQKLKKVSKYKEIVFCGFGEATLRLNTVIKIAAYVKRQGGKVRLTTNGQGNLIAGYSIAPKLKGIVDAVSVSLNEAEADMYSRLCCPSFGKKAYSAIMDFIK
ncbi:MAG: YchF/TatD family DNA exonuclease [Candidatus Omnitrophica bacterium]|nr:YchF/TatD family DNA exonuclease [Candidatus Omnitrophota bacterium]